MKSGEILKLLKFTVKIAKNSEVWCHVNSKHIDLCMVPYIVYLMFVNFKKWVRD